MKKVNRLSIASLVVMSVLMVSVSSVFASSADVWTDPVATANNGSSYSSTVIEPASLPGIVDDDAGMILPVGFTSDSGQIGGNGIQISGLATHTDTVDVCFSFPTYRYGWTGSIYEWSGSAWVKVPTTLVAPTGENTTYFACASKVSNGTYALIIGYDGEAE